MSVRADTLFTTYADKIASPISSVLGGNVVAVLFRQTLRANALINSQLASLNRNPISFVAGVPVTVKKQENFSYEGEATQSPVETGAIISDHVILAPIRIDINFEVTNWDFGVALFAHELFKLLRDLRIPLDLLTEFGTIPNVVLLRYNGSTNTPKWGMLTATASFQQIGLGAIETEKYTEDNVTAADETGGPDIAKSAAPATNVGIVQPKQTTLKKLWGLVTK